MTTIQESQFGMYNEVLAHLLRFSDVTAALPEFDINVNEFTRNVQEIQKIANLQSFDKTGFAREKEQLRGVLEMITLDNALKVEAYGKIKNNIILTKEVSFTKSKLSKAKDNILAVFAQMIYDKAQENLPGLGAYGITEETQSVMKNTIDSYKAAIVKPRLGLKEKKEATKQLHELFMRQDLLLEKIDSLINIIRLKNPDFYSRYKELRKVVIIGSGKLSLKASVTEMPSGIPVKGVIFEFIPEQLGNAPGSASAAFVRKTAQKGAIHLKNVAEGAYRLKISKTGYKSREMEIKIIPGEMVDLKVELEKV